ncbi:MAG: hypothetical protein B7X04_00965 [Parcubacteria group bacterium 21-54-25]|nr:MAG: hypothetical protein B7X04_00965 [Parcubacteria group bacterium 21-54-25]HQU07802.1 membrane dipeptidase [Candidatus Paceibacterota bacterium]
MYPFADSMVFLAPQGREPLIRGKLSEGHQLGLAVCTSVAPFVTDKEALLSAHARFVRVALTNPGMYQYRCSKEHPNQKTALVFGLQHLPKRVVAADIHTMKAAGVDIATLAYKEDTEYGVGCLGCGGLKPAGEEVIRAMAEVNMILDLSHLNEQTTIEAFRLIERERLGIAVCATHSACREVFTHPRNISDVILQLIAKHNGYVGIPLVNPFLCIKSMHYLRCFVHHVEHAVRILGKERVGIGSDAIYWNLSEREAERNYNDMASLVNKDDSFRIYFPHYSRIVYEHGLELGNIVTSTLIRYLPQQLVECVCSKNLSAFLARALPSVA